MSLLHISTRPRLFIGLVSQPGVQNCHSLLSRSVVTASRIQTRQHNAIASRYLLYSRKQVRFSTTKTSSNNSRTNVANFFSRDMAKTGDASRHAANTTSITSATKQRWAQIAWYIRVARIPVLISALYSLGYQQGVLDSVRNPNKIQQMSFETCCLDMGVTSGDEIDIIWERKPPSNLSRLGWFRALMEDEETKGPAVKDPRAHRVASVGRDIVRSARTHIREQLDIAIKNKQEALIQEAKKENKSMSKQEAYKAITEDSEVQKWTESFERIEGYTEDGIKNWQFILLHTDIPNAFVSEMLPQRVFVTTGLFEQFVANDDELAMIMGHELSHLVLGHGKERLLVDFMLRGLEIAFLMLDPTEGLLSLGIAAFLASTREALTANTSRETENEADELGCKFAAMACYDTRKGSHVFHRMHEFDVKHGHEHRDLMSSHPASMERFEFVKKRSEEVNPDQYSVCGKLESRMRGRALSLVPGMRK